MINLRNGIVVLSAVVLSACASMDAESGKDFDMTKAGTFQKGKSRKADIVAAMGEPANSGTTGDGSYIEYRYSEVKSAASPLAAFGIGSVKADEKMKQCRFNFDVNEKLKDHACQEGMPDYSGFGK